MDKSQFNIEFGSRLYEARKRRKLSMKRLGEKVNLHESTISRYEKGDIQTLDIEKVKEFAKALEVTPQYLMGWDEKEPEESEGDKLRKMRLQNNLALSELANDLHISVDDMQAYENNKKQIPTWVASAVARYFGIETPTEYHSNRYQRMMEAMNGEILSDEEFDKVIDYVKFIVSQRGK